MADMTLQEKSEFLEASLPGDGLFADKDWRKAAEPFPLPARFVRELAGLGRILLKFYQSISDLHRFSHSGKEARWVGELLDAGKPAPLLGCQSSKPFLHAVPRVIRPDILLTENGWAITELDSVPGGIGLTAWLNQVYSRMGHSVIGGESDMINGFFSIFSPDNPVHLVVSEEAATYRPEMEWLAQQASSAGFPSPVSVRDQNFTDFGDGDSVYRFFELFDLANVPSSERIIELALDGRVSLTPPPRPIMEEKLNLALLWNRNLEDFWIRNLGRSFFEKLMKVVPRSWVVDPAPLPPHAAIPGLEITDWHQLKSFSQKKRNLILKVSGFSESAWGARGVHLGSDMPADEWGQAIDSAVRSFDSHPHILQTFEKPTVVRTSWIAPETFQEVPMKSRVRLCPYYFVSGEGNRATAELSGILATLCPEDKKIIHGMSDAVLAPCSVES